METPLAERIAADPNYQKLRSTRSSFGWTLTIAMLVVYYGFILLIAFNREVFAAKVGGNVTFGIYLGIGVILACFLLTGIYVRWANDKYDAMVGRLKQKAGHGQP